MKDALVSGKIKRVAELPAAQEEELALYAGARMIVSAANNRYLINRYAVAEAKRAGEYLGSDDAAHPEYADMVAAEFGIGFEKQGKRFPRPACALPRLTPRSFDYKLTNREVCGRAW